MSDLNWCTYCDNAIDSFSDSLYCSEVCLRQDVLGHHPLLGYDWGDLKDFPRSSIPSTPPLLYQRSMSSPSVDLSSISSSYFTPSPTPPTCTTHNQHQHPPSASTNKAS